MKLLPLHKLGPREIPGNKVIFGLFLPWVSAEDGYRISVRIIHEKDQFIQAIPPKNFEMQHSLDPEYGDYWSVEVGIQTAERPHPQSAWGHPGRYVYRFLLDHTPTGRQIDWIVDPFAREYGIGKLSAFTLGYDAYTWSPHESSWKTPKLHDLAMYELMISEFGGDIDGAIAKLDYLRDLGITAWRSCPSPMWPAPSTGAFYPSVTSVSTNASANAGTCSASSIRPTSAASP